jgi:hypothetical protein
MKQEGALMFYDSASSTKPLSVQGTDKGLVLLAFICAGQIKA